MRKLLATPLASAVIGGGVTAGVLLGAGVVDGERDHDVYQQAPLARRRRRRQRDAGLTARDIYKRDAPGVVFVRVAHVQPTPRRSTSTAPARRAREATGSGFVLDDEGHILTNAHVVDGATAVAVTFSGKTTRDAQIVGKDESHRPRAAARSTRTGSTCSRSSSATRRPSQVGDPTVAIGNPFGFDRTLTTGVVSALQRRITAPDGYTIENVIQTDAAINPGNSGGPLIDAGGRVIGINSQIATGGGPAAARSASASPSRSTPPSGSSRELKAHGRVERPWLGLEFVPSRTDALARPRRETGLLVQHVMPGGPAAAAGVRGGNRPSTSTRARSAPRRRRRHAIDGTPIAAPTTCAGARGPQAGRRGRGRARARRQADDGLRHPGRPARRPPRRCGTLACIGPLLPDPGPLGPRLARRAARHRASRPAAFVARHAAAAAAARRRRAGRPGAVARPPQAVDGGAARRDGLVVPVRRAARRRRAGLHLAGLAGRDTRTRRSASTGCASAGRPATSARVQRAVRAELRDRGPRGRRARARCSSSSATRASSTTRCPTR